MTSRDIILDKLRAVQSGIADAQTNLSYKQEDFYKSPGEDLLQVFKTEIENIAGKCIVAEDLPELFSKLAELLTEKELSLPVVYDANIQTQLEQHGIPYRCPEKIPDDIVTGISACDFLVARTGSVLLTSSGDSGRRMIVYPPVHIIIATESQLVSFLQDALELLNERFGDIMPSQITTITGPSRTADIEKTLVLGAHGPKELIIFVLRNKT